MKKNIAVVLAAVAAAAVVFVGVRSFACDKDTKTANNYNTTTYEAVAGAVCPTGGAYCSREKCAQMAGNGGACSSKSMVKAEAGSGCCAMRSAKSEEAATEKGSCGSHTSWTATLCGTKGYYAANVYTVRDGQMFAVCQGKTFEVTANTPFVQVDEARYYFADEASKIRCHELMKATVPAIDREVVSLATAEANIVDIENGQKVAQCPVTGRRFVVTADSPTRVVDGQKYYMSGEQYLSTVSTPAHH